MSVSRVRHRGREPRDVDHGPANGAGGVMTLGAHAQVARIAQADASKLVEVGGRMPDGGAGAIERSMATEAQRAAWRAAEEARPVVRAPVKARLEVDGTHAKGSPAARAAASKARQADYRTREGIDRPVMGSPEHIHASRMRGAARHLEVVAARRPVSRSPVTPEEEPSMATQPPPLADVVVTSGDAIEALHNATTEALAAWEAWQEARRAEVRWEAACRALEDAWRRTGLRGGPTSIDDALEAMKLGVELGRADAHPATSNSGANIPEIIPEPPVRERVLVDEPSLAHELAEAREDAAVATALRDDRLGDELGGDAREVVTRRPEAAVAARPDPEQQLPRGQREALAAVIRHGGDRRKAAEELHRTLGTVEMQLEYIGKKGLLPIELIAKLPARYAKYSGVSR